MLFSANMKAKTYDHKRRRTQAREPYQRDKDMPASFPLGQVPVKHGFPALDFPFWVISDTHFEHANIGEYGERPDDHQQLMLDNWRHSIKPTDRVLHLGDLALGKTEVVAELLADMPGEKYLLKGNHDRRNRRFYEQLGFTFVRKSFALDYAGYKIFFTHRPDTEHVLLKSPRSLNVHGHIHQRESGDPRLINLSVEHTDYAPVHITDVLDRRIAELNH